VLPEVSETFRPTSDDAADPWRAAHALTLVSAYQGMSMMANALRDPQVMDREGARLTRWLESLRP
jgi:TetR/AcrR family transcriptional regulator, transcriptional repressor for nem operon